MEENNILNKKVNLTKKTKIVIGIVIGIILIGAITIYCILPPSVDSTFKKALEIQNTGGTEEAIPFIFETYGINSENGIADDSLFPKLRKDRAITVMEKVTKEIISQLEGSLNEFENIAGTSFENFSKIKIDNVEISKKNYSSEFVDLNITIKNDSDVDINYIKVNIYLLDNDGKTVKSDWTNDSACIKPGAQQIISKMLKNDGTWSKVQCEIVEVR